MTARRSSTPSTRALCSCIWTSSRRCARSLDSLTNRTLTLTLTLTLTPNPNPPNPNPDQVDTIARMKHVLETQISRRANNRRLLWENSVNQAP